MMSGGDIIERIECALEKARWRKLTLRGLYLDEEDYAEFAAIHTKRWQEESGSDAKAWPLRYESVLLLGKSAIPVKDAVHSAVYATTGEGINVPKRLSSRTEAASMRLPLISRLGFAEQRFNEVYGDGKLPCRSQRAGFRADRAQELHHGTRPSSHDGRRVNSK